MPQADDVSIARARRRAGVLTGLLALAALLGVASPAQSATIVYEFAGVVSTLVRDGGLFGLPGTVQVGDSFTGHLSYEVGPGNPDQLAADTELGGYAAIDLVIDQSVLPPTSPLGIGVIHAPGLPTLFPLPPDPGRDWFSLITTSDVVYPTVSVRLRGPFGSAFSDDSLPETLDLADFPDGAFVQGLVAVGLFPSPSIEDVGQLTSLTRVPEPGALVLVAAGLAALARRRSQA